MEKVLRRKPTKEKQERERKRAFNYFLIWSEEFSYSIHTSADTFFFSYQQSLLKKRCQVKYTSASFWSPNKCFIKLNIVMP